MPKVLGWNPKNASSEKITAGRVVWHRENLKGYYHEIDIVVKYSYGSQRHTGTSNENIRAGRCR